jgi:sugar phosphate isomerase/epimerase
MSPSLAILGWTRPILVAAARRKLAVRDARAKIAFTGDFMRLGTTSFIYQAGWLENVQRLGERVRDVELLCFDASELPGATELRGLAAERRTRDLSYTVHTPLDASLASPDPARRRQGLEKVRRVIEALASVEPLAYVLHVYAGEHEHDAPPDDLDAWRARATESLAALARDVPAERLCVESLDYDLAWIAPVVEQLGLGYALDVGHVHRDGRALELALNRYLPRTRIVQWHGTDPLDRDHRSLAHYPEADALFLLRKLREARYDSVLTLEVFREADFESSLALVERWMSQIGERWES